MFFYSWLLHICIPVNAKFIILIVKSSNHRFLFKLCLDWYFLDTTLDYRNLISNILKHQCDFVDKLHIPTPRLYKEPLSLLKFRQHQGSVVCSNRSHSWLSKECSLCWRLESVSDAEHCCSVKHPKQSHHLTCSLTKPAGKTAAFLSAQV